MKFGSEDGKATPSKIKNVTKSVRSPLGNTTQVFSISTSTMSKPSIKTPPIKPLKAAEEINEKQSLDISSTLLELGKEIDVISEHEPVISELSASDDKGDTSPSKAIRTLDEINRETLKMLSNVPLTEQEKKSEVGTEINTIQPNAQPMINMENCLKLFNDEQITSLFTKADQRINSMKSSGKSKEKLSPEDKISLKLQNVCEQILSPNVPMSANIASMFAKRRNGSSKTGGIESPELMRVRIAESLLLLGELNKSSCKFFNYTIVVFHNLSNVT